MTDTQKCNTCGETKSREEYTQHKLTKSGLTNKCKDCTRQYRKQKYWENAEKNRKASNKWLEANRVEANKRRRWARLEKLYGLTETKYNELLASQNYGCAICENLSPGVTKDGHEDIFKVDHNHTTGKVRGLLCNKCNIGIGQMEDDPDRVLRAAFYLMSDQDLLTEAELPS